MSSAACCKPAPPAEHIAKGKEVTIAGLKCYVANPSSKTAVILASDVFGVDTPLVKKFIDDIGAAGFYAICPDFLHGDPYVPKDPANLFANFGPWIAVHHPDASLDECKSLIKELKAEGVKSIGITGCCWGARLCVMIGKEDDLAKAIVLMHPSLTTKENVQDLKIPTAIFGAEIDDTTPPALVQEFKKILDTKPFPSSVKVFPGQAHGWTIRYDVNVPSQVKGAKEAHADMLAFYKSVL